MQERRQKNRGHPSGSHSCVKRMQARIVSVIMLMFFIVNQGVTVHASPYDVMPASDSYYLDANLILDGEEKYAFGDWALIDVYINGTLVSSDCGDYCSAWPSGYEWKVVYKAKPGYHISGQSVFTGTFTNEKVGVCATCYTNHWLTEIHHNDGATTFRMPGSETTENVEGKDVVFTDSYRYDDEYGPVWGMTNVDRFTKPGWHSSGYWYVGYKGSDILLSDSKGYPYTYDLAKDAGVLDALDKGDVTLDLYPYFIPDDGHRFLVTLDPNGGKMSSAADGSVTENTDGTSSFQVIYNGSWYCQLGIVGKKEGYTCSKITDAKNGGWNYGIMMAAT